MSKDEAQAEERLDFALERIAAEKRARTGLLDLGNLGLTALPTSFSELDWLEELRLCGVVKLWDTVYRLSDGGSLEQTDEAYNPNRIRDLAPSLIHLPRLHILDCSGADPQDLTPLARLTALQSLNCGYTQVTDLIPLAGLSALQSLDCWNTPVADLTPLAGLMALQSLDCTDTPRSPTSRPWPGSPRCSTATSTASNPVAAWSARASAVAWMEPGGYRDHRQILDSIALATPLPRRGSAQ